MRPTGPNFDGLSIDKPRWHGVWRRGETPDMALPLSSPVSHEPCQPYHFSVKAVRLNRRISWCRGSTRLVPSSSSGGSSPGFYKSKFLNSHCNEAFNQTQEQCEGWNNECKESPSPLWQCEYAWMHMNVCVHECECMSVCAWVWGSVCTQVCEYVGEHVCISAYVSMHDCEVVYLWVCEYVYASYFFPLSFTLKT